MAARSAENCVYRKAFSIQIRSCRFGGTIEAATAVLSTNELSIVEIQYLAL